MAFIEVSPVYPYLVFSSVEWFNFITSPDHFGFDQPYICAVDLPDFTFMSGAMVAGGYGSEKRCDFTGDGYVDLADFSVFGTQWGWSCYNYNPATLQEDDNDHIKKK